MTGYIKSIIIPLLILIAVACNNGAQSPSESSSSPGTLSSAARIPPEFFGHSIPATYFGMTLINRENWPEMAIGALGKGTEVNWAYVQQTKGSFDWSGLDQWVASAEAHHVDYFFSNDLIPAWAAADKTSCHPTYPGSKVIGCKSMVSDLADWSIFVQALVTRYKGRIKIYELWNEPDQDFTGSMQDLVMLTGAMLRIIRANDPAAIVLSPSATTADYLDRYWTSGGPTAIDGVSLHGYATEARPDPEGIVQFSLEYRNVMATHGVQNLPLWDTEGSWGDASRNLIPSNSKASFTARHLLLHWSLGIERYYWYAWDNAGWGTLWTPSSGLTSSGLAYREVMNWMSGARMPEPCKVNGDSTWECVLKRTDGDNLVVWNSMSNRSYVPSEGYLEYTDLSGTVHSVRGSAMIGQEPVLFRMQRTAPQTISPSGAPMTQPLSAATVYKTSSKN